MNPPTLLSVVFLQFPELDGGFLHNHSADSGSDCGKLLSSTPATRWYKILPPAKFIHEVRVLNECWQSQNSMADSSITAGLILDLIAGGCWARHQLRGGIRYVSIASELMNSPTLLRVVFRQVPELDGMFVHNHRTDSGCDCGGLLGSMPAT